MKKLFALLMALVLVISAVPLMASATEEAPCEHYKNEPTGRYLGGNQHEMKCLLCEDYYFAADCYFVNGKCIACGNAEPDAVCQHYNANPTGKYLGGNKHEMKCKDCNELFSADCYFGDDGECDACGNTKVCQHYGADPTGKYLGNNKHEMKCKDCNELFSADCYFVDGECIACGNAEVCKHYNADPTGKYLGNNKHEMKCKDCGGLFSADCYFVNGECIACGNAEVCKHYNADPTGKYLGNNKHEMKCKDCGGLFSTDCYFVDGVCIGCGHAEPKPSCNHEGEQVLVCNYDGTHNARCANPDCGMIMAKNIPCVKQANGKCACGWDMNCKHEGAQLLVPNDDGRTHNAYCANPDCNELMAKEIKCVKQANGKCACGRVMTGKPVADPTLDKVPKTGDVLAPVALLSGLMSTVGLAVKKFFF